MSNVLEYTLSLQDQISAKLNKIDFCSDNALNNFVTIQMKVKKTRQLIKEISGTEGA